MKNAKWWVIAAVVVGCGVGDPEIPLGEEPGGDHGNGHVGPVSGETVVAAASTTDWVYWSFSTDAAVTVSDPMASNAWDLRVRRTSFGTNSGTTGMALGGAIDLGTTDWAAVEECPSTGWVVDALLPLPGPPGSGEYSGNAALAGWYDYDPVTHAVSSKGTVFCLRTGLGRYAKFQIVSYGSGQHTLKWRYQPDGTRTVAAP